MAPEGYMPAVYVHVAAGAVAILAGFAALSVRKGERAHRAAGKVFVVSMLAMGGFAAAMALMLSQRLNVLAGLFTAYMVASAWLTVRRAEGTVGRFELAALAAPLGIAATGVAFGLQAASPAGLQDGDPTSGNDPETYFAFATLATLAAALDVRVILKGGLSGAARISRHLWRMCLALFVAAGSFFLGQQDEIPVALRGSHLVIPPLAALAALAFWMVRVRLGTPRSAALRPTAPGVRP